MKVKIYTDGGYSIKNSIGGWGFVVVIKNKPYCYCWGLEKNSTCNRMELQAILKACQYMSTRIERFRIFSDSQYAVGQSQRRKGKDERTVNADLINQIVKYRPKIFWERRSLNDYNKFADLLATLYDEKNHEIYYNHDWVKTKDLEDEGKIIYI